MMDNITEYLTVLADYAPIVEFFLAVIIIFFVYMFFCRPIINQIITAHSKQPKKALLIKDKKYEKNELEDMRNKIVLEQSEILHKKLKTDLDNVINNIKKVALSIKDFFSKHITFKKKERQNKE